MAKTKTNYDEWKERLEKSPEYAQVMWGLRPVLELACSILELRLQRGLTIQQMARLARVRAREAEHIEYAIANPRLKTLIKLARAMGGRLEIRVVANDDIDSKNAEAAA